MASGTIRSPSDLAARIEHTSLRPSASPLDIDQLCDEALALGFGAVCVASTFVDRCVKRLEGSAVMTVAVAGFPLGTAILEAKAYEAAQCAALGAAEVDMVINVGLLKADYRAAIQAEIAAVVGAAKPARVKVIIETGYLDDSEKILACRLARAAGAAFVKTCTGFGPGHATPEDVRLMAAAVEQRLEVKASGGIRSFGQALSLIEAGATRLGTSAGVTIYREAVRALGQ
jgi:deoxyribose-phosphate aldolase